MGTEVTGRHAETVYRDKQSGKRVEGGAAELEALEESRKKPKAETPAWGGGIAQVPLLSFTLQYSSYVTTGSHWRSGHTAHNMTLLNYWIRNCVHHALRAMDEQLAWYQLSIWPRSRAGTTR